MTKHVFEMSPYTGLWYRGEYAGETDKTFKVKKSRGVTWCVKTGAVFTVETDDDAPEVVKKWDAAALPFDRRLTELDQLAAEVRVERREACLKAIGVKEDGL